MKKRSSSAPKSASKKKKKSANASVSPPEKNRMAQSTSQRGHNSVPKNSNAPPKVLICGYYGFDNLGDELILKVLVDELKARGVSVTVLSQDPKKTAAQYGVSAIKRTSFIDIVDALASANLFISGGGGLFQDVTGPMSTLYYGGLIHLARFFDVPVVFWAQGVGPLNKPFSRRMTASALRKCEKITVRDEKSAALVADLLGQAPEITADPVWLLKKPPGVLSSSQPTTPHEAISCDSGAQAKSWTVGLSLRPWPELTEERLEALADCLNAMAQQQEGSVCFKLLPFQRKEDSELLASFANRLNQNGRITVEMVSPESVLTNLATCDLIVGMRFHSLILGLLFDVPVYGLVYDPKVASLLSMFALQGTSIVGLKAISPDVIQEALAHYPRIDLKPFQKKSQRNLAILERLLDIPATRLML